jgi:ribosomal protein S18 acetylase RimI-like enzyme
LPAVTPIRAATAADIPAVLALWERERSGAAVTLDTEEAVTRAIEMGALLLAERGGSLSGTVIAAWDGWRGNLYRLVVESAERRRGIGRALVEEGERRLRARGATRITALVGRQERDAAAFWQATGYADDPKVARFVRNV